MNQEEKRLQENYSKKKDWLQWEKENPDVVTDAWK